ncbi:MAG: helix-turn-helix transcriptional regulator [Dehalococcoidia bacterium]
MIVNHLSRVLGEQRLSVQEVARRSGLSYTTVHALYHDRVSRFDRVTIDRLCAALGVDVCEILEFRPSDGGVTKAGS